MGEISVDILREIVNQMSTKIKSGAINITEN